MNQPIETLVYLFKHLSGSDRSAASQTCQLWYISANDTCFLNNKYVYINKVVFEEADSPALRTFEESIIAYPNYVFKEVEISSKINTFWENIGSNIRSLTLENCDICEKVFIHIINHCPYLLEFKIESCPELFMSGRLMDDVPDDTPSLPHLKSLSLAGNRFLSDAIFIRFVKAAPNLQELNLSSCSVSFHVGLFKRFYPFGRGSDGTSTASESILTFHFVLDFIKTQAHTLKKLSFSSTLIDGTALKCLSEVVGLNLDTLEVRGCDQLTNTGILALTSHQKKLRVLDIGLCSRVTDQSLLNICENLSNLEELNIQRCRAVTDIGLEELNKLKKLKILNISQCELVTSNGLLSGICRNVNPTLQSLDINSLNLDQECIICLSEKLPQLRSLNLSYCFNAVTDASIQAIFKNQIWLRTLKMSYCDKVSDAGLTGMGKCDLVNPAKENSVGSNPPTEQSPPKINLGSRAENEIVRDAQRKRDVMMMCENISDDTFIGFSLSRLKGLIDLDISGCNRITDVSLRYAFNLKELVSLDLSWCQQVTHEGMEFLVKQCPSIECLKLVDCYNIKDAGVATITKGLRRLKQFHLRGCNQLTDKSLECIRSHCERLSLLDVRGCRNLSSELANSLYHISTLRTVLTSKPGPYINEANVQKEPPAPPVEPRFSFRSLFE